MRRNKEQKDEAVSPVVGVMLMLVVTIIIAAVVSGFAGGLAGGTKTAPQAAIDVSIPYNSPDGMGGRTTPIEFKLLSGDPIPTKDLSIITYFTNSSGYTYKHEQTASSDTVDMYPGWHYDSRVPALWNFGKGKANEPHMHFGNFTWVVGDQMSTGGIPGTASLLGLPWTVGTYPDPDTIDDADFKTGAVVDVKILHIPSGKYIYDKEVIVS